MKKINFFLLVFIIISCGENVDRKKNKFEYKKIEKKEVSSDKKSKSSVIVLNSSDLMKFDQNELRVFDLNDFAQRAMLARENEYIPVGDETIAYTKMIGGGESDTITFTAPKTGSYTYICTFPGHYGLMKGVLIVS